MKNDNLIHLKSKKFAIRIINTLSIYKKEKASKQIVHCFKGS
jgi:hypothetical protein